MRLTCKHCGKNFNKYVYRTMLKEGCCKGKYTEKEITYIVDIMTKLCGNLFMKGYPIHFPYIGYLKWKQRKGVSRRVSAVKTMEYRREHPDEPDAYVKVKLPTIYPAMYHHNNGKTGAQFRIHLNEKLSDRFHEMIKNNTLRDVIK